MIVYNLKTPQKCIAKTKSFEKLSHKNKSYKSNQTFSVVLNAKKKSKKVAKWGAKQMT